MTEPEWRANVPRTAPATKTFASAETGKTKTFNLKTFGES